MGLWLISHFTFCDACNTLFVGICDLMSTERSWIEGELRNSSHKASKTLILELNKALESISFSFLYFILFISSIHCLKWLALLWYFHIGILCFACFALDPIHVLALFPRIHWALPIPADLFLKSRFHIEKKEAVIIALSLAYFTASFFLSTILYCFVSFLS